MSEQRVAVVAGGSGVIGDALVRHLEERPGWEVVALSRQRPVGLRRARHVAVDLLDPEAAREGLAGVGGATDLFFAAYQDRRDPVELADVHQSMLRNFVQGAAAAAPDLRRVVLYEHADRPPRPSHHSLAGLPGRAMTARPNHGRVAQTRSA